jgi:hypothetical protein
MKLSKMKNSLRMWKTVFFLQKEGLHLIEKREKDLIVQCEFPSKLPGCLKKF